MQLNSQHCDETHRELMNETGYALNVNKRKSKRMSSGHIVSRIGWVSMNEIY